MSPIRPGVPIVDGGVGRLPHRAPSAQSAVRRWTRDGAAGAAEHVGRFQVPTLRNVDKRPYPEFREGLWPQRIFHAA